MEFEFDPQKRDGDKIKHGIDFNDIRPVSLYKTPLDKVFFLE
jgi:uncharacterized DUF497 family protein